MTRKRTLITSLVWAMVMTPTLLMADPIKDIADEIWQYGRYTILPLVGMAVAIYGAIRMQSDVEGRGQGVAIVWAALKGTGVGVVAQFIILKITAIGS
jgi:hypothetical protein